MRIWRVGSARNAVFFHSFVASLAGWESQLLRTGGCGGSAAEDAAKFAPRLRARTIWKSKSLKTESSEHFWKLKSPKFAPRLRARTIWKSKSLKHHGPGPLFEVQSAFCVAGAGIWIRFKMRGRRRSS